MDVQHLVKPPKRLKSLAIERLAQWVASQARTLRRDLVHLRNVLTENQHPSHAEASMHHQIEIIWNFLEYNVPKLFHNRLAIELVRALSKQEDKRMDLRTKYIERGQKNSYLHLSKTLFSEYLTTFVTKYAATSNSYFLSGVYSGITCLELEYSQVMWAGWHIDKTNEANIIQMLESLPNLKHAKIETVCSDNILRCLADHCKQIEELNLILSSDVNDNSITILTQFPNLKKCNLSGTSVTKLGMANFLKSCGYVEVVINFWSNTIAEAIEHISSNSAGMQFKLKSYANRYDTPFSQLLSVLQNCPQIQKLEITKFAGYGSLEVVKNLENLIELSLTDFDLDNDQITEILKARGSKLVDLRLDKINQISLNTLIDISQMCPNLQSLIISGTLTHNKTESKYDALKILPFRDLKTLVFHAEKSQSLPCEEELLFLLSNSPNIEFVRTSVPLTDDIMLKIFHNNRFIHLEKLKMLRGGLSVSVIERIVRNCIIAPELINYPMFFIYDGYEF